MNKRRRLLLLLLTIAGLGFPAVGMAQQPVADNGAPVVHTVDFPAGDAAWVLTSDVMDQVKKNANPAQKKPAGREIKTVQIVRKGQLRHDLVTWSDGTTTEYWWAMPFVLYTDSQDNKTVVMDAGNMGDHRFDESLFTWVSAGTYTGMEMLHEKKCRHYQMEHTLPNMEKELLQVWIDNKTARPVAWTNSALLTLFDFDVPLPPEPLVLPAKFKAEYDRAHSFIVFPKRTDAPPHT